MGKFSGILFFWVFAAAGIGIQAGEAQRDRIDASTKWLCYYGDDRRVLDVEGYDLLILESEAVGELSPEDRRGRLCVAYMSVGEAEQNRWFYPNVKDKPWVLDANPEWPDSRLVDPRDKEWSSLVVDAIAADIIDAGYDGFMLDNVDTAEELLRRDPERYKGAAEAMAGILRALRAAYPDKVIIANGGLSVVPLAFDSLDAVMYEGTCSSWKREEDGTISYGRISPQDQAWLRPRLLRIRKAGLPVLALEYADPADTVEIRDIYDSVAKSGNSPYVSQYALDDFPGAVVR